jgi:hypothetical protein
MRKTLVSFFAVLAVVAMLGYASQALAATQAQGVAPVATKAPTHHGHQLGGTVSAYDEAAKSLKLKDSKGKEHDFSLTTATVLSGTAKVGEHAVVAYMIKDGKNIATSIHFSAPAAPKTTTSTAAPVKK